MTLTRGFARNAATTPLDTRLMDMATIAGNSDGSARVGVIDGDGRTLVTALATMNVAVAAADFVTSKGVADGVMIFTNDGTVNVAIGAAPVSNSRIDVIWVRHQDDTTGDAASTPIFGVTAGTAAASPTKPAIPTGALELATLRVYSGSTASNNGGNVLTNTYAMTASRGGVVPFRTKADIDLWTNPLEGTLARDLAAGRIYERIGGAWLSLLRGIIRPSSVSGAGVSIGAEGQIIFTAAPAGTVVQIRDIFSSAFRNYRITGSWTNKPSAAAVVQGIVGTTPVVGISHSRAWQSIIAGVRDDGQVTGAGNFGDAFIPIQGSAGGGDATILAPNLAEQTYILAQTVNVGGTTGVKNITATLNASDQLTGLQITLAAGSTWTGELRVVGVA